MDSIIGVFTAIPGTKTKNDDDAVDRLSNSYTVILIVVFAIIVGAGAVTSNAITCWAPAHFTDGHTNYANAYCWVRNTYYLPYEDYIPTEEEDHKRKTLPYYQWIPFILLAQALGFFLPSVVWHGYNQSAGVDADTVLDMAGTFGQIDAGGNRDATLMLVRNQMDRFLVHGGYRVKTAKERHATMTMVTQNGRRTLAGRMRPKPKGFGCYLIILYIFTKVLYLANVVGQLFILNSILAVEYSVYGIEVFRWMINDYDWTTSPQIAFPRVTMCDFNVRRLGNIHRYTVQCTLPINLYNEKIYMFLWFWMVFVAICTAISLVTWFLRLVLPRDRITYIHNHLRMLRKISDDEDYEQADRFTRNYLRQDGVFLLRLIGHNTNTLTVSEIIGALWDNWKERDDKNQPPPNEIKPTTEEEPMLPLKEKPT